MKTQNKIPDDIDCGECSKFENGQCVDCLECSEFEKGECAVPDEGCIKGDCDGDAERRDPDFKPRKKYDGTYTKPKKKIHKPQPQFDFFTNPKARFTKVYDEILYFPRLTPNEKLLYCLIYDLCLDNPRGCFANDRYFADVLEVGTRAVQFALVTLEKKGLIKRETRNKSHKKKERKIIICATLPPIKPSKNPEVPLPDKEMLERLHKDYLSSI
jgi:hypothetical protein